MNFNKSFNPDFWLTAMFNYTYAIGKYTKYEEADFSDTPWRSHWDKRSIRFTDISRSVFSSTTKM